MPYQYIYEMMSHAVMKYFCWASERSWKTYFCYVFYNQHFPVYLVGYPILSYIKIFAWNDSSTASKIFTKNSLKLRVNKKCWNMLFLICCIKLHWKYISLNQYLLIYLILYKTRSTAHTIYIIYLKLNINTVHVLYVI